MARHSDSEEDYKSKKKSKRRSRSRSSSHDSYSRRKQKKKKSKSKKSVRSRSNSSERSYRSSRSKVSRRSRSRSRDRRSRSRDRTRRSRSRDRYTRSRRSRSRSTSRSRYRRSRSLSRSRRSRSRTPRSRSRSQRSRSRSRTKRSRSKDRRDPTSEIPGFSELSASEQAEQRLQLAIKAAARADEKIKKETSSPNISLTFDEQHRRAKALEAIDRDEFMQAEFVSNREQKLNTAEDFGHDDAMFGTGPRPSVVKREPTDSKNGDSILHPNFFVSVEDKMPRWIQKLTSMRRKKLEGESFM